MYNVTWEGGGLTPGITVISSPGASWQRVMPQVGLTRGRQDGGVAPGEPHLGLHPGPFRC